MQLDEAYAIVRGAVSPRELVPVLSHIACHAGRLHGFNGRVHISAPCEQLEPLPSFTVPATAFAAALNTRDDVELEVKGNKLIIRQDSFKATLPIGPIDAFPIPEILPPQPSTSSISFVPLLFVLKQLYPFIGEDATRPWCATIKFQQHTAMATNNSVLAFAPCPAPMPEVALPVFAIEELLRIHLVPDAVQLEEAGNALVFHLPGGLWIRTLLMQDSWPDAQAVYDAAMQDAAMQQVPDGLAQAVQQLMPFCPDPKAPVIELEGDTARTRDGDMSAVMSGFSGLAGAFMGGPLATVLERAVAVGWNKHPRVPWLGKDGLRGVLVGVRGA